MCHMTTEVSFCQVFWCIHNLPVPKPLTVSASHSAFVFLAPLTVNLPFKIRQIFMGFISGYCIKSLFSPLQL